MKINWGECSWDDRDIIEEDKGGRRFLRTANEVQWRNFSGFGSSSGQTLVEELNRNGFHTKSISRQTILDERHPDATRGFLDWPEYLTDCRNGLIIRWYLTTVPFIEDQIYITGAVSKPKNTARPRP